ncbi:DUF397 domain-containing protein [Streptomyces sp. DW26H14]|uniref:DUF397 domain-containing protein n=1 Tax=Streptomyces sp. DW26H14 TaxID=3435395 RepID=UPI00403DEBA0
MASGNLTWRKSSYSNGEGGECLEVADGDSVIIPVRDSKTLNGPVLRVTRADWSMFVTAVRDGAL